MIFPSPFTDRHLSAPTSPCSPAPPLLPLACAPVSTAIGAAALIGYLSSRRASSSALIAEISASTASTCSLRARRARTAATRLEGTYLDRPRPAAFGGEVGVRTVWFARGAAAIRLARNGGSARPATRPAPAPRRRAAPPTGADEPATSASTTGQIVLVALITQEYVVSRHHNQHPGWRVSPPTAQPAPRSTTDAAAATHRDPSTTTASSPAPTTPPAHTNTVSAPRPLDEQHLQPLPVQRMERMRDDDETQIVTGRRGDYAASVAIPSGRSFARLPALGIYTRLTGRGRHDETSWCTRTAMSALAGEVNEPFRVTDGDVA